MSYTTTMQTVWAPERDSIFGDTHDGVPNPNVPHVHPWPTRYHGPNFTVPGTAHDSYVERPYARAPYLGFGAEPAPLFAHLTGSAWLDALMDGAAGYYLAPKKEDRVAWAIGGALAGYMAGTAGGIAVLVAAIMARKQG